MEYESGAGGLTYRYTYGVQKSSVVIYGIPNGTGSIEETHEYASGTETIAKLYYHQDRLGSADYLTNNIDGKVESYAGRDDWGEPTMKPVLKIGARQLDLASEYAGYGMDGLLGLYYARARMYDAANRRFASADPVKGSVAEPQTMAQYTYCLDNPIRYADPLGLAVTDWDRAHLSEPEIAALEANTAAWIAADAEGNQAAKDAAHAASEAIRNKYRTGTETESENKDGNTVGIPDVEKPPTASDVVDTTEMGDENRSILDDYVSVVNSYSDGDLLDLAAGGYMGDNLISVARAAIASLKAGEKARAAAQVRQLLILAKAKALVNGTDEPTPSDTGVNLPDPGVAEPMAAVDESTKVPIPALPIFSDFDGFLIDKFDDFHNAILSATGVNPSRNIILSDWDKMFLAPDQQKRILQYKGWWYDAYEDYEEAKRKGDKTAMDKYLQEMKDCYLICEDIRDAIRANYNGAFYASPRGDGTTEVDAEKLREYLDLSTNSFRSEVSAAWGFGQAYTLLASEWAANIYFSDGVYVVRDIITSEERTKVTPKEINTSYGIFAATIHTHSTYIPNGYGDIFSDTDLKYARKVEYLVTPGGYFIKYTKSTEKFEIISYLMPADPNHPNPNRPNYKHPTKDEIYKMFGR